MNVLLAIACLGLTGALVQSTTGQSYSDLWGQNGELWHADGRLPDFSFAGYRCGEAPLPQPNVVANVCDYGARGDDDTDDTDAFQQAIAESEAGALLIPAGRYLLSDILWIRRSNIVLRGEGRDKTILHITRELEDVRPNMGATTGGRPTSNYSWSGGFLWAKGVRRSSSISPLVTDLKRGTRNIVVKDGSSVAAGDWVQVTLRDDKQKTLLTHLYAGDPSDTTKFTRTVTVSMVTQVEAVAGNRLTLARPLRWDVRKRWQPTLKRFTPSVSEVGIEALSISFPVKPYKGHFTERGMNAIAMSGVTHCWIRDVRISNCDSGIFLAGTFCTIDGLLVDGTRSANRGDTGHHGVTMGTDCLLQNFDFGTKFIHDITLSNLQVGNVVKNGKGINLSFDHHKRAPYENLFCNIDVGEGTQIWRCGGGAKLGRNCGARGTFWAIQSQQDIAWPPPRFGPPTLNLVGVRTSAASVKEPQGRWFEAIPPAALHPRDLHAAQLARRLEGHH